MIIKNYICTRSQYLTCELRKIMNAIVEISGKQFKVKKDQSLFVDRLHIDEGKKVSFDKVLLLFDEKNVTIGSPTIDGATVSASILKHIKDDKVIVFKKKRRKGYKVKNGHRQALTEIKIEGISVSGSKKVAEKKETEKASKTTAKQQAKDASQDFDKMTVSQLKELAKSKGVTGISKMKKADLISALSN